MPEKVQPTVFSKPCPNLHNNPNCLCILYYDNKYKLTQSVKSGTSCKSCAIMTMVKTRMANNSYARTESDRQRISIGLKRMYEETGKSAWNKGLFAGTDERVAKTGKSRPGELNPMFGTSYLQKWIDEYGLEEATRRNNEITKLKVQTNGEINYNKSAIVIIEQYGTENGYKFRHAENHPEKEFQCGKYFADGYDEDRNVWLEYDEKFHFVQGKLRDKDKIRQEFIVNTLKCKFIRIKYDGTITVFEYEESL